MPRSISLILLLLTLTVTPVIAQQRAFKRPASPPASDTPGQRWAIIVGINRYPDKGVGNLDYAVADARALYQTLTAIPDGFPAQNVVLMTDDATDPNLIPTRSNLIRQLAAWLRLPKPQDTILMYFSGHGFEDGGTSYLLPQDAVMGDIGLTSLKLDYVKDQLQQCKANKKLLIVDACHSGEGKAPQAMSAGMAEALSNASTGMVVLASCDLQERSYEMVDKGHGAYTYFLIEALSGVADRDQDGLLSAHEVNLYAWDQTSRWAARNGLRQTPKYVSAVSGDIVLGRAARRPEPPPPPPPLPPVVTPPGPTGPAVSLDDLAREEERRRQKEAERLKAETQVKTQWENTLQQMEQEFQRCRSSRKARPLLT